MGGEDRKEGEGDSACSEGSIAGGAMAASIEKSEGGIVCLAITVELSEFPLH